MVRKPQPNIGVFTWHIVQNMQACSFAYSSSPGATDLYSDCLQIIINSLSLSWLILEQAKRVCFGNWTAWMSSNSHARFYYIWFLQVPNTHAHFYFIWFLQAYGNKLPVFLVHDRGHMCLRLKGEVILADIGEVILASHSWGEYNG